MIAYLKGHIRILELLGSVDYPVNNLSTDIIEKSIINGHPSLIPKLRVLGYSYFNDISDDFLDYLISKGDATSINELRLCNLNRQKWDYIKLESIEEAVRNGCKDVLEHIRMLNLTELLNKVAVEHVETSLERGHYGVLRQLLHSNYPKMDNISPQILANTILRSPSLEATLKNSSYSRMNEVKILMKNALADNSSKKTSKKKK